MTKKYFNESCSLHLSASILFLFIHIYSLHLRCLTSKELTVSKILLLRVSQNKRKPDHDNAANIYKLLSPLCLLNNTSGDWQVHYTTTKGWFVICEVATSCLQTAVNRDQSLFDVFRCILNTAKLKQDHSRGFHEHIYLLHVWWWIQIHGVFIRANSADLRLNSHA